MTSTAPAVRRVILGTAGHIDHGKTALVKRLTAGMNADRLPEERERGMTIDVGYATFSLQDGTEVGLVDVPGHERLVRTMVAAATAMDLALLVVAADDGPMPQTREHVEILDVLGVTRLVVALTKTDLVEREMCDIAAEEVRDLLATTGMEGAPILYVSSETGDGVEELRDAISATIPESVKRADDARIFRMPVLRSFLAPGRGAIVTGIPISGQIADGDRVDVLPAVWPSRVRGIQVHHRSSEDARAGHRAALALTDIHVDKVKRGMVVATAGVLKPVHRVAAKLRVLKSVRKRIEHGDRARLHLGSDQVVVRVHVPSRKPIEKGGVAIVELESDKPFVAAPGDRLVLRAENASSTWGGGVVVELLTRRIPPRRQGRLDALMALAEHLDDPQALVTSCITASGERGCTLDEIAAATALQPRSLPAFVEALVSSGEAVAVGRSGRWITGAAFEKVARRVEAAVRKLHEKDAAVDALSLAAVRSAAGRTEPVVLDTVLDRLTAAGTFVRTADGNVRHKDHSSDLPPEDKARCDSILALLAAGGGQPPAVDALEAELRLSSPELNRALRLLHQRRLVFKAEDFWFDAGWLEAQKAKLAEIAQAQGGFTPADARTVMNTTRKWVIPLLEALDKSGFSRRVGNKRVVK